MLTLARIETRSRDSWQGTYQLVLFYTAVSFAGLSSTVEAVQPQNDLLVLFPMLTLPVAPTMTIAPLVPDTS
jgi:hypothetical protein